jgi:hypothetical protein
LKIVAIENISTLNIYIGKCSLKKFFNEKLFYGE